MTRTTALRKPRTSPATPLHALTLPALAKGEAHAGILFKDGKPSHFVILLPGETSGTWDACMKWAKGKDAELPTRKEQALLFANAPGEFKSEWYWSGEQHASVAESAWLQPFTFGYQTSWPKSTKTRARAVRRVPI